jgi:hypothetical protein
LATVGLFGVANSLIDIKRIFGNLIPKEWMLEWGKELLERDGNAIIKMDSDIIVVSTINVKILMQNQEVSLKPGNVMGLYIIGTKPIQMSFHPPPELKI